MAKTQNIKKPRKKGISVCVSYIKGGFSLSSNTFLPSLTARTQSQFDISAEIPELCAQDVVAAPDSDVETPLLGAHTITQNSPPDFGLHVRLDADLDDCDRAVIAQANGLPLPLGWACIPGKQLTAAYEWDTHVRDLWARSGEKARELRSLLLAIEAHPRQMDLGAEAIEKLRTEVAKAESEADANDTPVASTPRDTQNRVHQAGSLIDLPVSTTGAGVDSECEAEHV